MRIRTSLRFARLANVDKFKDSFLIFALVISKRRPGVIGRGVAQYKVCAVMTPGLKRRPLVLPSTDVGSDGRALHY